MNWSWDMTVKMAALLIAVVTYLCSRQRELRIRRAELVRTYTNDLYADQAVAQLFMDIDHDRLGDWKIAGSKNELTLIRLLDHFNAMGHNLKRGVLRVDDIMPTTLAYAALRTWENTAVREYLRHIAQEDRKNYAAGLGFRYFEELATEIAWLCGRDGRGETPGAFLSAPTRRSTRMLVYTRLPAARLVRNVNRRIASAYQPKRRAGRRYGLADKGSRLGTGRLPRG